MTIEFSNEYWTTTAVLIEQNISPLFGPWSGHVSAAGRHGEYAGVMFEDQHLTIATARALAAELLRCADIAEDQAVSEV